LADKKQVAGGLQDFRARMQGNRELLTEHVRCKSEHNIGSPAFQRTGKRIDAIAGLLHRPKDALAFLRAHLLGIAEGTRYRDRRDVSIG